MGAPTDRRYSQTHEWHKLDGDVVTVGLTRFAIDQLTDLTFVEMRAQGTAIEPGDSVGEVESVKTTSDVYCAAGGTIVEVNDALADNPGIVNADPYEEGWLVKVKVDDATPLESLMDAAAYDEAYG